MELKDWIDYRDKILASDDSFRTGRRNNDLVNFGLATLAINRYEDPVTDLSWKNFKEQCKEFISDDLGSLRFYDWEEKLYQVWDHYNLNHPWLLERLLIDVEY